MDFLLGEVEKLITTMKVASALATSRLLLVAALLLKREMFLTKWHTDFPLFLFFTVWKKSPITMVDIMNVFL